MFVGVNSQFTLDITENYSVCLPEIGGNIICDNSNEIFTFAIITRSDYTIQFSRRTFPMN